MSGGVYFMLAEDAWAHKIGFSHKPHARMRELQTGCPYRLELMSVWECSGIYERKLHNYFADYRLEGEWFQALPILRLFTALSEMRLAGSRLPIERRFDRYAHRTAA